MSPSPSEDPDGYWVPTLSENPAHEGERGTHAGGWALIEVWVEHPAGMDPPNHNVNPDHPIFSLIDRVADAAHEWGDEFKITPYVGGATNENPPPWASNNTADIGGVHDD